MNTCKPQKISLLDNTNCLLPNDIIPVVQKGTNRTISAKNLIDLIINRIKDILPGSSEAMCIAVEAKKLAELASADATLALKNLANALAYATKAYQLACLMDSRILALEGDHALIIELQDALALLTRQVNINTQRINDIINSNILKITTDADNNYTIYTFYVDNRKIGEIKVPKPKEYTGSQYIDINEERVISLTGLANVAFTGDYTDLSNRPTKLTDFYIDIDFLKDSDLEDIEDRITDLEECCEELHTKYFKLINLLEENTLNIVYTIKVDNTRYVVPYDSTWDDIKIPSGSHTIEIAVNEDSFIEDYPTLSYNYVTETPMTKKNNKGTLWEASLKKINSNVVLKGKIWSSLANGTLKVYDVDTNTLLFNSADVIAAKPYTTTIYAPEGLTFLASVEINNLFPSSLNAKVTYKSGSNIELTLSNPTKDNIIYIRGLESEDSPIAENMYPIILAAEGPGSLSSDYNYYELPSDTFPSTIMIDVNYNSPQTYAHNIIVKFNDENGENVPLLYWEGISTTKLNKIHLLTTAIISDNIAAPIYVKVTFYTPDPVMHTLSLSNNIKDYASVSPTTFELGKAFIATVTPNTGYTLYLLKLLDYKGRYIPALIDGNTIDVHWDFALRDLTVDGQIVPNLPTINNANIYNNIPNSTCNLDITPIGLGAVITITPDDGYLIVVKDDNNNDKIIIENNGVTEANAIITSHTADYGVDITIPTVNGDIVINGESIQLRYTASLGTNLKKITGASISPTEGTIGENREFTITLPNTYELTAITSVTEDNSILIINNTTKVVINGNKVTVKNIAGDIVIDGTAQQLLTYSVSLAGDLNRIETTLSPTSVRQNSTLEAVVTNSDGVFITEVSMGGTTLLESDYTLTQNSFTNSTVTIQNVTGNVVITGVRGIRGYNDDPQLDKEFDWYEKAATYSELPRTMFLIVGNNLDSELLEGSVLITNNGEFIARSRYRGANSDFPYDEVWLDVAPWKLNITMNKKTTDASITYNGVTKTITGITLTANPKSGYCFIGESNAKYTAEEMSQRKIINLPLNSRPDASLGEKLARTFIYHLSQENVRSNKGAYAGYGAPPGSMTITVLGDPIVPALTITIPTDNLPTYLEADRTFYIPGTGWGRAYYNYCLSYTGDGFALNCDGTEDKNSHRGSTGIDIRFYFLFNEDATGTYTVTFTPPLYPDEDPDEDTGVSSRTKTIKMSVR